MQQVLKNLRSKKENFKHQRKRIQLSLQKQSLLPSRRKKYEFPDIEFPDSRTTQTNHTKLSFYNDVRFQKQMIQLQDEIKEKQMNMENKREKSSLSSVRYESVRLPQISKNKVKTKNMKAQSCRKKLKKVINAIIFINRLKIKHNHSLKLRLKSVQKYSSRLVSIIQKIVSQYYSQLLEEEVVFYVGILQKIIEDERINVEKQIMHNLYFISKKLAKSTVTKQVLEFMVLISMNFSFVPSDFLSNLEINRLNFSSEHGYLVDMNIQKTKMIIALCLGIKIFCFYILYQPMHLVFASKVLKQNYQKIQKKINNIGSIFYYIILDEFCNKITQKKSIKKKEVMQKFNINCLKELDPFDSLGQSNNSYFKKDTSKNIIKDQTRDYSNKMRFKYPQIMEEISENLWEWINRITFICIKEKKEKRKAKARESSSMHSTIMAQSYTKKVDVEGKRHRFKSSMNRYQNTIE